MRTAMRITWVLLSLCLIFHCVCSDETSTTAPTTTMPPTTTIAPTTKPIDKPTTIISTISAPVSPHVTSSGGPGAPPTTKLPASPTAVDTNSSAATTTTPSAATNKPSMSSPGPASVSTAPPGQKDSPDSKGSSIATTASAALATSTPSAATNKPSISTPGPATVSTAPPGQRDSPDSKGSPTTTTASSVLATSTPSATTNKPSISSPGPASVSTAPPGERDSPDSKGSSTATMASSALTETVKVSTETMGHSTTSNKGGEGDKDCTVAPDAITGLNIGPTEKVTTSATGAPPATSTTTITETQPKTFLFCLNDGQEREDEKDLAAVCRRLMEDMHAGNCTLTWRKHVGKTLFDSVEIVGKVKASLASQYYEEITKKSPDNTTLIAILASCGALLAMIIGLAIYASHHRKPFNENQQHLTEEMNTVENCYHDNPTLEVMEVQPEMQEKKVALNDSWIVPIDNLLKEDLPEVEDTHL